MIIQQVFLLISERAYSIEEIAGEKITPATAWKIACQIWLLKNSLLTISKRKEALSYFPQRTVHN
jgi:hypothetical protein